MPERITLEANNFAMEIEGEAELETWRRAKRTMDAYFQVRLKLAMEDHIDQAIATAARDADALEDIVRERSYRCACDRYFPSAKARSGHRRVCKETGDA